MQRYTKTAMLLHWLTALLIIAAFFLGLTMVDIHGITPTKLKYYSWHKWLGVTVLGVAAIRLLWRSANRPPPPLASIPAWQHKVADGMHYLLYFFIFAVPISGYLYSYAAGVPVVYLGLFQLPALIEPNAELKPILKTVHYVLTMTMAAAVVAHALAALKHHFVDRDATLKRMLP
ncbi:MULTISPECIES: cytochrome b [unclassified Duganella]|uniref:cytochrome b n=1 Tax=unclassified Duganella TaxID=2636909 RepID=UPI000E35660C|nr:MULTISPECIES: cytochrome b [unclassified Duganella]RFP11234.1 cytochrome b [Duganella sp. BJB475]RFP29553.1 cytochrome b [Duganella sp. BJB476]